MSDETRAQRVEAFTERLAAVLTDDRLGADCGYSRERCRVLAEQMIDADLDGASAVRETRERLLLTLLLGQAGIGEAEALVLSRALLRVRLNAVLISAGVAAELLDIHQTTLLRRRWEGDIEAALEGHGAAVYYQLADVLAVLAFQEANPYPGGAVRYWPPLR